MYSATLPDRSQINSRWLLWLHEEPPMMLDPRLMFCFLRTLRVWLFIQLTREQAPSSVVFCLIHGLVICASLGGNLMPTVF